MTFQIETARDILDTSGNEITIIGILMLIVTVLVIDRIRLLKDLKENKAELQEINNLRVEDLKELYEDNKELTNKNNLTIERLINQLRIRDAQNDK